MEGFVSDGIMSRGGVMPSFEGFFSSVDMSESSFGFSSVERILGMTSLGCLSFFFFSFVFDGDLSEEI